MTQSTPVKYSAEEWEYFRKRFFNSMLNDTQVAALGQNVGVSWPFKGSDETPAKYIEFDLYSPPYSGGRESKRISPSHRCFL